MNDEQSSYIIRLTLLFIGAEFYFCTQGINGEGSTLTLTFAYESYYIILWHIFSVFILLTLNFGIWLKAKKIPLLYSYLAVQGIIFMWMISKIFKTIAPNTDLKFFFVVCQYAGVCFLGIVFFNFAFLYAKRRMLALRYMLPLAVPSVLFLLTVATNPWHYLFYSHFDFWGDSFGPAFYLHQAYNYALILAGLILCAKNFTKQFEEKRMQAMLFAVAILVPIAANILYLFDWFELVFCFEPPFDITPITCNISLLLFVLATYKYRFFDDVKIARREALSRIPEGILLLDENKRIIDYNLTFMHMYEKSSFIADDLRPGDQIYRLANDLSCRIICRPINSRGRLLGYSLRMIDVTLQHAILSQMESKNRELAAINRRLEEQVLLTKKLSIARTRNFISGEVHDILGHSVILVITSLEVSRLSPGKQSLKYDTFLDQAQTLLEDCLKKLKNSILEEPDSMSHQHSLIERLYLLKQEAALAAIVIELTVTGHLYPLPKPYEEALFKTVREGITNAVRHGRADKITIILRFLTDHIECYVIDNGTGCPDIKKGLGLTGMEKRLHLLNGSFSCSSYDDQGFCVQVVLPAI